MSELIWETTTCDWCDAPGGEAVFSGPDLLMDMPGEFHLVRCTQCGIIRQNPRLTWESLAPYYPEEYSAYQPIIEREKSALTRVDRRYGMQKRVRAVARHQPSGRLLDVGCGTGVFLGEAQRAGNWELSAVEPSLSAASYVRQELNIPVINSVFADAYLPEETFDVLTMWNVLEHLENPVQDLQKAAGLLRPGGLFVFSIPNLESLEARLFGKYWLGWDLPRHLYLFPKKQVRAMLAANELDWIDARCIAGSHHALELSLRFYLKAHQRPDRAVHNFTRLFNSLPARLLSFAPLWIADRLCLCSLITIFARKRIPA